MHTRAHTCTHTHTHTHTHAHTHEYMHIHTGAAADEGARNDALGKGVALMHQLEADAASNPALAGLIAQTAAS